MELASVFLVIGLLVLGACLAAAVTWLLTRKSAELDASQAKTEAQIEIARLNEKRASEAGDNEALRQRLGAADAQTTELRRQVGELREERTRLEERANRVPMLEAQHDASAAEAKTAGTEVARLKERESSLAHTVEMQTVQFTELQKQLTTDFENIANRILKANTAELSENSQKALAAVLDPLRERLQDFQKRVETTYEAENREVLSLKEQIKLIIETSHTIGSQADGLAKALRGDPQLLGRWGELALERILEAAGLTEGREYISQGRGLGLKSETGGSQKPDIIVKLPEQRTMIVDSKVPLASYERLITVTDATERAICTGQFVRDLRGHIDDLAGKRYQENEKLQAHDCVLMFVPIEGALAAGLTADPELFVYGWERRVVLVGPPTLLMTMRTVASIWRYEDQGQNAQHIARLAGDLCDKVSASLTDLNAVTERITGALDAHNEAVKRLATGKGNALSLGERIRGLGVKAKKPMPAILVDGAPIAAAVEDPEEDVPLVDNSVQE
ncbi:MAG: DNA recombination protein RmuC [Terriglobia bacterium]